MSIGDNMGMIADLKQKLTIGTKIKCIYRFKEIEPTIRTVARWQNKRSKSNKGGWEKQLFTITKSKPNRN